MKLLQDLIGKIMNLYEEFGYRKFNMRSISHFYKCYNIALAVLGREDLNKRKKNMLWKKLLQEYNSKTYLRLKMFMKEDFAVILEALREIQKQTTILGLDKGDLWAKDIVGVQSWEIEEEE